MEILIPGLILVALMVYVSTKIKKNAARAYEREIIETPEFSIVKPEGFICPVDHDQSLAFAAYSKEYGWDEADALRQVSAEIRIFRDDNFDDICERAKIDSVEVISEVVGVVNGSKCCVIRSEGIEKGLAVRQAHKIVGVDGKIFELTISVLPEHNDTYSAEIDELLESFTLR